MDFFTRILLDPEIVVCRVLEESKRGVINRSFCPRKEGALLGASVKFRYQLPDITAHIPSR